MHKLLIIFLVFFFMEHFAIAQDAETVLRKADGILSPANFVAQAKMTVVESAEKQRSYEIEMSKSGKNQALVYFHSPAIEKGRKILRRDDSMWMYLPSTKKIIRVSSKQSLLNGDFSFADMTRLDFIEDYNVLSMKSTDDAFILSLSAKNRSITYERVEYKISKYTFMPVEIEYLSLTGKVLKKLTFLKPIAYGALVRPSVFLMQDSLHPSKTTSLVFESLSLEVNLPAGIFDPARL